MSLTRAFPIFVILLAFFAGPSVAFVQDEAQALTVTPLYIETTDGRQDFDVEFASTPAERSIGLMFRTEMADDHGMIFSYSDTRVISMWMKNTFIPLDILFMRRNGRIANIVENTTPHSLDSIVSQGRVIGV